MEYQLARAYVRMRENGPRRAVLMIVTVMAILAGGSFLGGTPKGHDPIELAISFGITALVMGTMLFFQIRVMRRALVNLSKVRFILTDGGLSVVDPSTSQLLNYNAIRSVDVLRGLFGDTIKGLAVKTEMGTVVIPNLEHLGQFVADLKRRLPTVPFSEKRKWWA
jgi:hypothetical protein